MSEELKEAVASRINDLHQIVLEGVSSAKQNIDKVMNASIEIGMHIEQIPKGLQIRWLHDNCPGITEKQIAAYLSIAHIHKKRGEQMHLGQRVFSLIGLIDQTPKDNRAAKVGGSDWLIWSGKIKGYFNELTKSQPVETWPQDHKDSVAAQLKPIVDLYERITRH